MPSVLPNRTILIVDDEPDVCDALVRVLGGAGYRALSAESGEAALEVLAKEPVQLIISDNQMSGMSGLDLLKQVRLKHPHVLRIMLTGDAAPELAVRSINEGEVYRFIRKPWNNSDLRNMVGLAFDVIVLEGEKRQLLAIVRRHQAARERGEQVQPLEDELLLLAEADFLGN